MGERMRVPVFSVRQLGQRAEALLAASAARGRGEGPPVPVEWIAEHVLDLAIVWESLPTSPETPVLGGLDPLNGEIVLNEGEAHRFQAFPGLEAFTLAHEVGHWLLHVPPARRRQSLLPGWERVQPQLCGTGIGLAERRREEQADRFAALLLMPARLLLPRCERLDLTRFPARYKLRDQFGVSITAMNLRLRDLGYGTFNERDEYVPGKRTAARRDGGRNRPTRLPTVTHGVGHAGAGVVDRARTTAAS